MANQLLKDHKALEKEGKGSVDYATSSINILVLIWSDKKVVTILSNNTGIEPMQQFQQWCKNSKQSQSTVHK